MSFLKQSVHYLGLFAGLATIGAAGAVLLTYLFTGRLPVINMEGDEKPKLQLCSPDEIVTLMRQHTGGAEAAAKPSVEIGE